MRNDNDEVIINDGMCGQYSANVIDDIESGYQWQ